MKLNTNQPLIEAEKGNKSKPLLVNRFTKKEIKDIWKNSLITESHWFFVKNYLNKDGWCSNTEPRYLKHDDFDVEVFEGIIMFRPKALKTVC
jgi:hypothetical protein